MNACAHMATYWAHRAKLYRALRWPAMFGIATVEARIYRDLANGIIQE